MTKARPRLVLVLGLTVTALLYLGFLGSTIQLLMGVVTAQPDTLKDPASLQPQGDFSMFWYSGTLIWVNFLQSHGVHAELSSWFWSHVSHIVMVSQHPLRLGWLYPPTMGLLAVLYALFPLKFSFWIWRVLALGLAAFLLRYAGLPWRVIVMGLAGPAELHDMVGGQNGAITGGILVSSLLLMDTRPKVAGALAGLLCIKPQMGIALPAILLMRRYAVALGTCLAVALALIVLTLPLEGWAAWVWFFEWSRHASFHLVATPFHTLFPAGGVTVFFMARSYHASLPEAWFCQAVSSFLGYLLLWRLWREPGADPGLRMVVTICLTILITPYSYLYDLVGYSVAMAVMFMRVTDWRRAVFGLLWVFSGYCGTLAVHTGHITLPVAAALAAALTWQEMRSARAGMITAPHVMIRS
jgi:hypothetical protein